MNFDCQRHFLLCYECLTKYHAGITHSSLQYVFVNLYTFLA